MSKIPEDLIHAAFFFIDIVGLSNPMISTETQRTKIKILNEAIYDCKTFVLSPKDDLLLLPTGDGMLIGFKDGLEQPLKLAIELHRKLNEYNKQALSTEKIVTRIGCNIGHVFVVKDIFNNVNLWGPGSILSRRVMDLGDQNHILITANMANDLIEFSEDYKNIIHPIHDYKIKHNEEILVYSAYGENFGNENPPKKTITKSQANVIDAKTICHKIIFNIRIKDSSNIIHTEHERIYDFVNDSSSPIYEIYVGIMTNTEAKSEDLNLKALDEDGNDLEISKISSISSFSKKFTIKLKRPIFRGAKGRQVQVYYEKSEVAKFFDHKFFTNTNNFELNFIMPPNFSQDVKLYIIDTDNNKKIIPQSQKATKNSSSVIQWNYNEKINLNDRIHLEWS